MVSLSMASTFGFLTLPRRVFIGAMLACLLAGAAPTHANGTALEFVQQVGNTAITDLTAPGISDSDRVTRMRKMLSNIFDEEAVARFVLGPYARRATPAEFKEFVELYKVYVAHNYASLFKRYSGKKVEMQREQPVGNDEVAVIGVIRQPAGPTVNMEMRVHKVGGAFKALDLKIEGVSMPLTHRKQFASVLNQRGNKISGLLDALRGAITRFEAETPSK